MDKHLLLTAALFRTDIENEVEQNDDGSYSQYGKKRVEGYEISLAGNITPDWQVIGGYTQQHASVREGANTAQDGTSALPYTPEHAFTLWSQYQATDAIALGAGARYIGSMHRGSDGAVGTPSYTEGYWVADAKVGYRINRNVDLQLNVYNLFDTHYVASINKSGYRYWFTDEEIERQNRHNSKFETPRLEQELVDLYFRKPSEGETGEFVSVARAMQIIGCNITQKLSSQKISKAFSDLGFNRLRTKHSRGFIAIIRTAEEIRNYQISLGIDASSNLPF